MSKAEQCKARANEAFKAQDFEGAIAGYSGAIQADPTNPVYFSNRAMAYLKVWPPPSCHNSMYALPTYQTQVHAAHVNSLQARQHRDRDRSWWH